MVAFLLLAGVVVLTRVWQIAGREAVWWNDSADFLTSAETGLFSVERWAGPRTVGAPLVLSLARFEPRTYVNWQAVIAAVCWGALATSVWTLVAGRRARWVASLAVVAFSCTVPVTMWERSVLSESLGISTLALLVAATLVLARGVTGRRVVAVLGAAAVWLATRDSHASVVLVAAVCLAVGVVVAEWRARSRQKGGDRNDEEGGEVDGEASRHDRSLDALIVLARGLFCLGALATHPTYLLTEPLRDPERTFNNALGDRSFYAPMDQREVPLVTDLLVPAGWLALVVVGGVAAWATWRRRWGSPLLLVGAITVALAVPHGLVSWHSDGMETARHLIVPVVQLHLGALLMVIGASVRIRDDLSPSGPPPQAA